MFLPDGITSDWSGNLDRGGPTYSRPSTQAVAIAFFLALVGLAMAIYLVSVRSSTHSWSAKH